MDPGSDQDSDVLGDLPASEGLHQAQLRARRMEPFIMCAPHRLLWVWLYALLRHLTINLS